MGASQAACVYPWSSLLFSERLRLGLWAIFCCSSGPFEVPGMGWLFCTFEMKHRQGVKILVRQEGTKGSIDGGLSNKYPLKNVKSPPDMTVWQVWDPHVVAGLRPPCAQSAMSKQCSPLSGQS